ncbi:MAG: DUF1176 domain-containing protein [Sphingobium sp.]
MGLSQIGRVVALAIGMVSAQAALAAPTPGPLEIYRDWAIGCDNIGSCTATSLLPEKADITDKTMAVLLSRDAGPAAAPHIALLLPGDHQGPVDLLVDGVRFAGAQAQGDRIEIDAAHVTDLVKGMVRGLRLIASAQGRPLGTASLAGASAALRYMDARQGRAGTVTGLVATGKLSAGAVKAAARAPVIYHLPVPRGAAQPSSLWREERGKAIALSGCADEQRPTQEARITPLSDKEELVLIPCGAGAYNFSSVPLIATGQAGRRQFALAKFDLKPGWGEADAPPMLVNASWDAASATLTSHAKGRGLGDCGSSESYVWDGSVFRLTEMRAMNQCRGAREWLRLWHAQSMVMPTKKQKKQK